MATGRQRHLIAPLDATDPILGLPRPGEAVNVDKFRCERTYFVCDALEIPFEEEVLEVSLFTAAVMVGGLHDRLAGRPRRLRKHSQGPCATIDGNDRMRPQLGLHLVEQLHPA